MIAIGIITAVFFAEWQANKKGIKEDIMFNLAIVGVIGGIVGCDVFGKAMTNVMSWGISVSGITAFSNKHIKIPVK